MNGESTEEFAMNRKICELDGVKPHFPNDARHTKRYFYLKYCCALLFWSRED